MAKALASLQDPAEVAAFLRDAPGWLADWTGFRPDSMPPVEGGVDVTFQDLPLPQGAVRIEALAVAPEPEAPAPRKPDAPPRLR